MGTSIQISEIMCDIAGMIQKMDLDEKIEALNTARIILHRCSPFIDEPVDCVIWTKSDLVYANDYNPNSVAPPEMELLKVSIEEDGYTQPIVAWNKEGKYEVVDGFHRNRVGRECESVKSRIHGYLPLSIINSEKIDRGDRIASTIRHNRARGKHKVDAMGEIVIELKKRNWSNEKISKNLGMDQDEILRLCQISGLSEVFSNEDFSEAWEAEIYKEEDFSLLSEEDIKTEKKSKGIKRILHTWDKWECYKAGFYEEQPPGLMTADEAERSYKSFLEDIPLFEKYLQRVIDEWKNSCEHYLTNENMNRIAWLGQASVCMHSGIPAKYRGGYNLLTEEQKMKADFAALKYLNKWLTRHGYDEIKTIEEAQSKTEANLY